MFKSTGRLHYERGSHGGYKLVLLTDQGIVEFYRSLIPKYHEVHRQRYASHISVVRKEVPQQTRHWGRYEGRSVGFRYNVDTQHGPLYWWLDTFSHDLDGIRAELGLPLRTNARTPKEFKHAFHLTLGNTKERE